MTELTMSVRAKFKGSVVAAALFAAGVMAAVPALAEKSETLFSHKHWQVEVVAFDDGDFGCVAQVTGNGESFSLWSFSNGAVRMQFFSPSWAFGEGDTADLQVQIDRNAIWNLTNAELYKNSVLFNLPNDDSGLNFLYEVAKGNRLFLRDNNGGAVQDYSLAGSKASMDVLVECGKAITSNANSQPSGSIQPNSGTIQPKSKNPFKK